MVSWTFCPCCPPLSYICRLTRKKCHPKIVLVPLWFHSRRLLCPLGYALCLSCQSKCCLGCKNGVRGKCCLYYWYCLVWCGHQCWHSFRLEFGMVMDDSIYDPLPYGCSTWRMCTLSRYEEIGSMRVMESLKQRLLMILQRVQNIFSFIKFNYRNFSFFSFFSLWVENIILIILIIFYIYLNS